MRLCNSQTYRLQKLQVYLQVCAFSVYIVLRFDHNRWSLPDGEILHTLITYVSRRRGEQWYTLLRDQYNWDRNYLFLLLWYTFHHSAVVLSVLVLPLDAVDFKKREYFLVHWLIVLLVTLIPSCCQRWYFVLNRENPSICWWTARTIISGSCLILSKPSGSTNCRLHDLQRKLFFVLTFLFRVPFLTTSFDLQ